MLKCSSGGEDFTNFVYILFRVGCDPVQLDETRFHPHVHDMVHWPAELQDSYAWHYDGLRLTFVEHGRSREAHFEGSRSQGISRTVSWLNS